MTEPTASALYGVDGARGGWAVVRSTPDLRAVELCIESDLKILFAEVMEKAAILAIDIPIGLPESEPRGCDRAARRILGQPRGSSVFPAPMRSSLSASTYLEACDVNEQASGRRLSRQSFAILTKIQEIDGLMSPERQTHIYEAHPEVTFRMIAEDGQAPKANKKRLDGRTKRRQLLERYLPSVDPIELHGRAGRHLVQIDDVHDALACLLTAWRIAHGHAVTLPGGEPHFDARGLRMEIVC